MIVEASGSFVGSNFIDMTPLFEGLTKQLHNATRMLQHNAGFMDPSIKPNLYVDPQSVKNSVKMNNMGSSVNLVA